MLPRPGLPMLKSNLSDLVEEAQTHLPWLLWPPVRLPFVRVLQSTDGTSKRNNAVLPGTLPLFNLHILVILQASSEQNRKNETM